MNPKKTEPSEQEPREGEIVLYTTPSGELVETATVRKIRIIQNGSGEGTK
ncbi:MAG: hypothetical protein HYX92_13865 [Chloroflexi bacterium]|nr:hypothetical protein [Chloroflexota bacterium]